MKTISTFGRRALAVAALGLASSLMPVAHADTLGNIGWAQGSQAFSVVYPKPPASTPTSGSFNTGGFEGEWNGDDIYFWCMQLEQTFSFSNTYTDYVPVSDTSGDPVVATLLGQLYTQVFGPPPPDAYDTVIPDSTHSAAFQLAIWEIVYDHGTYNPTPGNPSGLSLASGDFTVTSGSSTTRNLAQGWLDALATFTDTYHLVFLQSPNHQDFVTFGRPPRQQVPEPHGLALVALAMLAAMGVLRKRRPSAS